ncbi:hypothetical protein HJFPF1_11401 [Paramyrothecium foliicola]|nr:hypothetical protein HJFPF1_11401 [Paramyrothecium foliicola]
MAAPTEVGIEREPEDQRGVDQDKDSFGHAEASQLRSKRPESPDKGLHPKRKAKSRDEVLHPKPKRANIIHAPTDPSGSDWSIRLSQLSLSNDLVSSREPAELICSYNWLESMEENTPNAIVVPDSSLWVQVAPPSGIPSYPFEPVFCALDKMQPKYRFNDIDVLIDRESLEKLLYFCEGCRQEKFRLAIHIVGSTLIVSRQEKYVAVYHGPSSLEYKSAFMRATTHKPPQLANAGSHHRVLRYKMGSLNCAVRFQANVQLQSTHAPAALYHHQTTPQGRGLPYADIEFDDPSPRVSFAGYQYEPENAAEIVIQTEGEFVRPMAKLWFGRMLSVIESRIADNSFDVPIVKDTPQILREWEQASGNQRALRKLVNLLETLCTHNRRTRTLSRIIDYNPDIDADALRLLPVSGCCGRPLTNVAFQKFWGGR